MGIDSDVSTLTQLERDRYRRQLLLPSFGEIGQLKLKSATVVVVGAGGLGCAVLTAVVSAGVGRVIIFDFDHISLSNLHRQPLYTETDIGALKVEVACRRLNDINPHVHIEARATPILPADHMTPEDESMIRSASMIIDCTDRFDARLTIATYAHALGIPHCYGAVSAFAGQVALFLPRITCFCCLFPMTPPAGVIQSCNQAGVLGVAPQVIGSLQASLALEYLSQPKPLITSESVLTQVSLSPLTTYQLKLQNNPKCNLCSRPDEEIWSGTSVHAHSPKVVIPISSMGLKDRLERGWAPRIIDVRSREEFECGSLPNAHLISISDLEHLSKSTSSDQSLAHLSAMEDSKLSKLDPIQIEHLLYSGDLLIYCEHGPRSERAAVWISTQRESLTHTGSTYELTGGYQSWLTTVCLS